MQFSIIDTKAVILPRGGSITKKRSTMWLQRVTIQLQNGTTFSTSIPAPVLTFFDKKDQSIIIQLPPIHLHQNMVSSVGIQFFSATSTHLIVVWLSNPLCWLAHISTQANSWLLRVLCYPPPSSNTTPHQMHLIIILIGLLPFWDETASTCCIASCLVLDMQQCFKYNHHSQNDDVFHHGLCLHSGAVDVAHLRLEPIEGHHTVHLHMNPPTFHLPHHTLG